MKKIFDTRGSNLERCCGLFLVNQRVCGRIVRDGGLAIACYEMNTKRLKFSKMRLLNGKVLFEFKYH